MRLSLFFFITFAGRVAAQATTNELYRVGNFDFFIPIAYGLVETPTGQANRDGFADRCYLFLWFGRLPEIADKPQDLFGLSELQAIQGKLDIAPVNFVGERTRLHD